MFFKFYKIIKKILPVKLKDIFKNTYIYLLRISGQNIVKSRYGILLKKNWSDPTFNFIVRASYGHYFWDFLSNISKNFIFIDIGSNQGLKNLYNIKIICKRIRAKRAYIDEDF